MESRLNEENVFRGEKADNVPENLFLEDIEVVDEYSVSEYSDVRIIRSKKGNLLYQVIEPKLNDFEKLVRKEVYDKLINSLKYENIENINRQEMDEFVEQKAKRIINDYIIPGSKIVQKILNYLPRDTNYGRLLDDGSIELIMYYIKRDLVHYGKITPLMNDKYIEDISCDGPKKPVFIYHKEYRDLMTNIVYSSNRLDSFVRTLAQRSNKHISVAEPLVDGSLEDGSRVQLTLGEEVTDGGSNFTIRKFEEIPFTPIDLIKYDTFSIDQMVYLWLAIENNKSLIFAGGTASGKTTSMNAVSLFIPPGNKVITIEDTREIQLRHKNWVKSVTREGFGDGEGEVDMYQLLESALRQRPEYMIVGEIRGEEARSLFQAMSTGHTTYSTMHADTVPNAINRLENPPIEVPRSMLTSLDIISIQEQTMMGDDRVRRNKKITEIGNVDPTTRNITTDDVYERDTRRDVFRKSSDSNLMDEIKDERGWSEEEYIKERDQRERVIRYMLDNDITSYRQVVSILRSYMINSDEIINAMDNNNLENKVQEILDKFEKKQIEGDTDE